MASRKRTRPQRAADLVYIQEKHLMGWTQMQIAVELSKERGYDISRQQVDYDLRDLERTWRHEAFAELDEVKGKELAKIDRLLREYWQAWERSRQEKVKTVTSQSNRSGNEEIQERVEREYPVGDGRFLDGIRWCIEQRLKIFGVYAAEKLDLSWRDEAKRNGVINPDDLFEHAVREYQNRSQKQLGSPDDARGGSGSAST